MASSAAEELDIGGVSVRFTSPDKIYYPALGSAGGTKRHLVEYYRSVALGGQILGALQDRPTHLQRFPDGVEGEEVYQKRIPAKHPDHVETCEITFPSGRKADVLRVRSAADVVWAANLGTVTFHPWAVQCPDVEHPNELRIDLDPQPGTGFAEARSVAIEILRPLHLHRLQSERAGSDHCVYSARKTPRATVSTPLTWDELPDVDPDDCTIATVPALLERRADPMAEMHFFSCSLEGLLEMSARDEANGLGDLPYPPNYPKMPGEPKRVQPSRNRDLNRNSRTGRNHHQ